MTGMQHFASLFATTLVALSMNISYTGLKDYPQTLRGKYSEFVLCPICCIILSKHTQTLWVYNLLQNNEQSNHGACL